MIGFEWSGETPDRKLSLLYDWSKTPQMQNEVKKGKVTLFFGRKKFLFERTLTNRSDGTFELNMNLGVPDRTKYQFSIMKQKSGVSIIWSSWQKPSKEVHTIKINWVGELPNISITVNGTIIGLIENFKGESTFCILVVF